jgi:hypothetical protein
VGRLEQSVKHVSLPTGVCRAFSISEFESFGGSVETESAVYRFQRASVTSVDNILDVRYSSEVLNYQSFDAHFQRLPRT